MQGKGNSLWSLIAGIATIFGLIVDCIAIYQLTVGNMPTLDIPGLNISRNGWAGIVVFVGAFSAFWATVWIGPRIIREGISDQETGQAVLILLGVFWSPFLFAGLCFIADIPSLNLFSFGASKPMLTIDNPELALAPLRSGTFDVYVTTEFFESTDYGYSFEQATTAGGAVAADIMFRGCTASAYDATIMCQMEAGHLCDKGTTPLESITDSTCGGFDTVSSQSSRSIQQGHSYVVVTYHEQLAKFRIRYVETGHFVVEWIYQPNRRADFAAP